MKNLVIGLLALTLATPAWAAKPEAASTIPQLFAARAACPPRPNQTQLEATQCVLAADQTVWNALDLDDSMKQAIAAYGRDMLETAKAVDAATLSESLMVRRRGQAELALQKAVFGRNVRLTSPGLDETRMPSKDDLVQVFPSAASAAKIDGKATMACRVLQNGALANCGVVSETPVGYGFGQAAVALSKSLRGKPALLNGVPVDGAEIRFALDFNPAWL